MKKLLTLLILLPGLLLAEEPKKKQPIEDPDLLYVGAGIFSIVRKTKVLNFQIEYRADLSIYKNSFMFIRPLLGVMATTKGSTYLYGGVAFDFFLSKFLVFTPSFAPGFYLKGKGKELGLPLEYRSSAELSYRFKNKSRLGAMFYHISNASLGFRNPGTECLVFFYGIPLN